MHCRNIKHLKSTDFRVTIDGTGRIHDGWQPLHVQLGTDSTPRKLKRLTKTMSWTNWDVCEPKVTAEIYVTAKDVVALEHLQERLAFMTGRVLKLPVTPDPDSGNAILSVDVPCEVHDGDVVCTVLFEYAVTAPPCIAKDELEETAVCQVTDAYDGKFAVDMSRVDMERMTMHFSLLAASLRSGLTSPSYWRI